MRKEYIWEIAPKNTPLLKRKCSHCDSNRFYCSENFRMNAQKKHIDIWLIYRCIKCDNTYNLTIFTRTKKELINKDVFNKFTENNRQLAWKYAFSRETSRKNNVELDFSSVEYDLKYDEITMENIINSNDEIILFKIKCPFDFNLKLSDLIRICFKLSSSKLNEVIEEEVISIQEKPLQKKQKVKDEDIVQADIKKLRIVYHFLFDQY